MVVWKCWYWSIFHNMINLLWVCKAINNRPKNILYAGNSCADSVTVPFNILLRIHDSCFVVTCQFCWPIYLWTFFIHGWWNSAQHLNLQGTSEFSCHIYMPTCTHFLRFLWLNATLRLTNFDLILLLVRQASCISLYHEMYLLLNVCLVQLRFCVGE